MTAPSLVTKLLKAFVPPSAVAGEATARASAKFRPDAREAASSQTVSYDSALATILFPSRDTSTLGARRRAANVMGTNRKKSSSKKRPCGEKRGGIPGAIAIPDSDDDATESTPTATTHDAPRETEAPMDVDDANEAVGELLRRIRSTQTRPNGWCDDVRSGIMLELAEFPGVTWTSTTLAFDHATLVKNHRVCDLHSRLSVIPIDDAMHEQPGVRAVTEYLARALDEGMVRKALLKDKEGKMLSKSRDTGEYMRRTLRNPNYPMEVTLWQVIALECKVGKALYEFMAKRAKMDLCKSDAEKTRCERELAEAATFLYTKASEMGDHGLIYAETVDKAGVGEKGAHFARLAARCWRGCAMLYERGADMREYESSTNRTLRQVAEDIRHCVGACAGNLANLYHHGSLNSPEHYGVSYRDSRATASQRALCIYFLEKGAEHGDYNAQHSLGKLIRARGDEANIWRAIQLYKMGADNADQVSTYACYNLGLEYILPGSVHENPDEALRYWRKGSMENDGSQGHLMCQMALRLGKDAAKHVITTPELALVTHVPYW